MPMTSLRPVRVGPADPLLTLEEAAGQLKIAPGTLKHWIALKRIEHVKVGNRTRIKQSALDRYVNAQTVAAVVEE
jgi:excisionase family DNA binding protein